MPPEASVRDSSLGNWIRHVFDKNGQQMLRAEEDSQHFHYLEEICEDSHVKLSEIVITFTCGSR